MTWNFSDDTAYFYYMIWAQYAETLFWTSFPFVITGRVGDGIPWYLFFFGYTVITSYNSGFGLDPQAFIYYLVYLIVWGFPLLFRAFRNLVPPVTR